MAAQLVRCQLIDSCVFLEVGGDGDGERIFRVNLLGLIVLLGTDGWMDGTHAARISNLDSHLT